MNSRSSNMLFIISIISGVFITVCDYLVQMITTEAIYFVSRLCGLNDLTIHLASYGCIFAFPFWIAGSWFVYQTGIRINKRLAIITTISMAYSLLILSFYHYSYIIIRQVSLFTITIENADWQLLIDANAPFMPFMFILLPVSWIIIGSMCFSSKSIVPRWSIILNPVILTVVLSLLTWGFPGIFQRLQPGIFSLGVTAHYLICYVSLKKRKIIL